MQFRHVQEWWIEHTASRPVVCLFGNQRRSALTKECQVNLCLRSRSSVCTAVHRFGLHSYFVSDSCLPPAANHFSSTGWIPKHVREIRDSRMIAGLVTVAPICTNTQSRGSCLHLGAISVGTCPLSHFSCSCLILTWSALTNVCMVRGIGAELDSCAGTSMSLICRDSDLCATLVLESRASYQARPTCWIRDRIWKNPRHRTRHTWLRRWLFCSLRRMTWEHTCIWIRSMISHRCFSSCRSCAGGGTANPRLDEGLEPSHTPRLHSVAPAAERFQ